MGAYQKLAEVQKELKAPKNQWNKFGKYNYRSCEDIIEAAKPLCIENGLVLNVSDTINYIGERYYVEATAMVTDIDDDKQIKVSASAREAESQSGMGAAQVTGSTSSYARKYALNGLFGIDDEKDDDTKPKPTTEPKPKVVTKTARDLEVNELVALITSFNKEPQWAIDNYNKQHKASITKLEEMPQDNRRSLYDWIDNKLRK